MVITSVAIRNGVRALFDGEGLVRDINEVGWFGFGAVFSVVAFLAILTIYISTNGTLILALLLKLPLKRQLFWSESLFATLSTTFHIF